MMQNSGCLDDTLSTPIDFHCHGIGRFDFTDIKAINLREINNTLKQRRQSAILTLYLPKRNFQPFLHFMDQFAAGNYPYIAGIGLEGPLLASHGGTPESGVWLPSKRHWQALAACGEKGLVYVILSPDAALPSSNFYNNPELLPISMIAEILLDGGVLPSPGHFVKVEPNKSAYFLKILLNVVQEWGECPTVTDHLYNDMPHNFKHAWRTLAEKKQRDTDIKNLSLASWNLDNLHQSLGPVPATMIEYARKGVAKLCQNFDGEHVDLAIVKRTVELCGVQNMLMMTDSIESRVLAGRALSIQKDSGLLLQDEGIVAAGSQGIERQKSNMMSIGLSMEEITYLTAKTPNNLLRQREKSLSVMDLCLN